MTCTHRKIVDYHIIRSRIQDGLDYFKKIVKEYIKEGYEPIGGSIINTDYFVQSVVKYAECPQHPELDEEEQEIEDNFELMELQKYYYKVVDTNMGIMYLLPKTALIVSIEKLEKNEYYYRINFIVAGKPNYLCVHDLGNLKQFYDENCK